MRNLLRRTRVRLSLAYGGAFSVVAVILAVGFWVAYAQLEMARVDDSLSSQARTLVAGLDNLGGTVTFQGTDSLPAESSSGIAIRALLLDPRGRVLDSSGRGSKDSALAATAKVLGQSGGGGPQSLTVGGVRQRVLAQPADLGTLGTGTLLVSRPIKELEDSLAVAAALLVGIVVVLVAVAAAAGYLLGGRALKPVHVIASTARELSERNLHRRIELDLPPDELGELVTTFNGMLERLEASFDALRRFTADAAHELRAPLAILRAEADVALSRERPAGEYRESLVTLQQELQRLSRTADHLLLLARADAGVIATGPVLVDVSDLAEETVDRWRSLAAARAVEVTVDAPEEATVEGDPDLVRRLLDNLVDNAIRHTPDGGRVTVTAATGGAGGVRLTVADTGAGIDPALLEHLFERFTRADAARQRETGGAGLGLALCSAIAAAHRGHIHVGTAAGGGALFTADLLGAVSTGRLAAGAAPP